MIREREEAEEMQYEPYAIDQESAGSCLRKGETELTERPHIRRTIRRCELSSLLIALESFRCSVLESSGTSFPLPMIRIVGGISKVAQLACR